MLPTADDTPDFLGRGIDFPLGTDAVGRLATVSGDRNIEKSIRMILSTAPGERPMRPEFGCGIHRYVFEPVDAGTAGRLVDSVQSALARWEPRIEVDEVRISLDELDDSSLYIELVYRIRADNSTRNLVLPYYVIPPEA